MQITTIDINSNYLDKLFKLSDANVKTLGLLPYEAIKEYAKKKQIFGMVNSDDELIGYLLFRISYQEVTIVHLCINENYRKQGIARKLVDKLKDFSKPYLGIKLKCRTEYEANSIWPNLNFKPLTEKAGRSKDGHLLTTWYFDNKHKNLFSVEISNKIMVAIDMNIFYDLKEKRNQESLALLESWLIDDIELCLTHEYHNEINKNDNIIKKKESRQYAKNFTELEFNEAEYEDIFKTAKNHYNTLGNNDLSDLKQIVKAIVGKAQYFITRDDAILKQKDYFEENYNITLLTPSSFITLFAEQVQSSKYQPIKLSGSRLQEVLITKDDIERLSETFLFKEGNIHEKKTDFVKDIREYLAYPKRFKVLSIKDESNNLLALQVLDLSELNRIKIPVIRFSNTI